MTDAEGKNKNLARITQVGSAIAIRGENDMSNLKSQIPPPPGVFIKINSESTSLLSRTA